MKLHEHVSMFAHLGFHSDFKPTSVACLGLTPCTQPQKNTPLVIPGSLQLLQVFGQSGFVHLDLPLTRCNVDIKYLRPTESPKRCKCQCKSPCKGLVSEGNLPFQHCRQKLPAAQALHLSFSKVLILCEDCVFCDPDEVQSTALMAGH